MRPTAGRVPDMDWTSTAQVMQGIYWTLLMGLAFHGFQVGNRMF